MKKLFIIPILLFLIACDYHKDESIYNPIFSGESYYMVRVFGPQGITNEGALIIYKLPMESITDKKVDSINKVADKYIENCKKYTND
jgi:hypothetical protein